MYNYRSLLISCNICVAIFSAFLQLVLVLIGYVLGKRHIVTPICIVVDGVVIGLITFPQIQTIRTSNALHSESTAVASGIINKKITKLSMQIMLLVCVFITSHLILILYVKIFVSDWISMKNAYLNLFLLRVSYWYMQIHLPMQF